VCARTEEEEETRGKNVGEELEEELEEEKL
jgi:hypothetical protein